MTNLLMMSQMIIEDTRKSVYDQYLHIDKDYAII
jgi:hypothetical protein